MIRSRPVDRSRLVGGGRSVFGGRLVGRGRLVFLGVSRVLNISNISGVSISNGVSHSLGTAVGEEDTVLAIGGISVPGFFLVEVNSGIVIIDSVGVVVVGGFFLVGRGGFVRGLGISGSVRGIVSGGHSQDSRESQESLQRVL